MPKPINESGAPDCDAEFRIASIIAAYQEGSFVGGSFEATYQLYVTEDTSTEYRIEEYNWLFAAERADLARFEHVQPSLHEIFVQKVGDAVRPRRRTEEVVHG